MKNIILRSPLLLPLIASSVLLSHSLNAREIHLSNPGFEDGTTGWSEAIFRGTGEGQISQEVVRSGKQSYWLKTNKDSAGFMALEVKDLKPNRYYHLSGWARMTSERRVPLRAGLKLEFYNASGKNNAGTGKMVRLTTGEEWTRIDAVGRAPKDTASVKLLIRVFDEGDAFFDDLHLEEAKIVVFEPLRFHKTYGKPVPVKLNVWIGEPPKDGSLPKLSLEARTGRHDVSAPNTKITANPDDPRHYTISATLPPIDSDFYTLNVRYGEHHSLVEARTFQEHPKRKPSRLDETGNLIFQGKPFFPIGMYHPQNSPAYNEGALPGEPENAGPTYALLAENGFNAIQGNSYTDIDRLGRYLDEAHKHGLAVDVPFYYGGQVRQNLPNSLQKMARFREHPAVLNWKISDEPDLWPEVGAEVPYAYYEMKENDGDIPFKLTLANELGLESWFAYADILEVDHYPVPDGKFTNIANFTRIAVKNKQPWQHFSFVIQCGWTNDLSNQPTVPQARSMVYQALIEGAKGIWWYAMYDPGWDLTQTSFWPHMKAINEEIKTLSEPLMLGNKIDDLQLSNDKVMARAVRHDGKIYLLLTNPNESTEKVDLTIAGLNSSGQTLDGEKGAFMQGKLRTTMKGYDSRTYVFEDKESAR